jgi:predicted DNA-binding transcriptional regulator YafY
LQSEVSRSHGKPRSGMLAAAGSGLFVVCSSEEKAPRISSGNKKMKKADRIYKLHNLLQNRRFITRKELQSTLEVARATLTRDIEFLRSQMNAPVVYDTDLGGYRLDKQATLKGMHELPGLWFNESEINALLAIEGLLESIQPGLLGPHIAPLKKRMEQLLGKSSHAPDEIRKRILLLPATPRRLQLEHFEACANATLTRKRLRIEHYDRELDTIRSRDVSPQRMVRYKENWYLDTWCHLRKAIRTFSVDAIRGATVLEMPAQDVSDEELNAVLAAGYGIYAGREVQWAVLKFSPWQARWTAHETWHVDQKSRFEPDGSYVLEIPYSGDGELVMDILKYGPDVEVLEPESLRDAVKTRLRDAAAKY